MGLVEGFNQFAVQHGAAAGWGGKFGAADQALDLGCCTAENHLFVAAVAATDLDETHLFGLREFEFLGALAGRLVGTGARLARVLQGNALRGLFAAFRFWTWETTVSGGHLTESALTPFEFTGSLFLDALYIVRRVFVTLGAVAL